MPDWTQFDFTNPTISISKADLALRCPLGYKYNYEDRLPRTESKALQMGKAFDGLCFDGKIPDGFNLLKPDDLALVGIRYQEYRKVMPRGPRQVPFQRKFDYGDWSVIGFIDLKPDDFPNAPLVEIKFSEKPWTAKKVQYDSNQRQAAIYAWACNHDFVQFHVMNAEKPGLQTYDVFIGEMEIDRALEDMVKACKVIEEGNREAVENPLCGWCNFKGYCPKFKIEGETNGSDINE
jgi:hypothetical protein